jgi:putative glutathione S-transferase
MGRLVKGKWSLGWFESDPETGTFIRPDSQFRDWITTDGSSAFAPEPGRYHLYVSNACPWAHRTLIYRKLKGLESMISISVVDPVFDDEDWMFSEAPGCIPDSVNHANYLHEVYVRANSDYSGIVTVPTLWDRQRGTIVNNESSDIVRMLNSVFDGVGAKPGDYYPEALRAEIDALNDLIYDTVNNGVYKCGFASTQTGYERAVTALFSTLDQLEERLAQQRYLTGDVPTEADWRLFPTLVRFDPVYYGHFKCNLRQLRDYPNLWGYTRDLYQIDGVAETVNMDHIKRHYYMSHTDLNPSRIVPGGPDIDLGEPHGRD